MTGTALVTIGDRHISSTMAGTGTLLPSGIAIQGPITNPQSPYASRKLVLPSAWDPSPGDTMAACFADGLKSVKGSLDALAISDS